MQQIALQALPVQTLSTTLGSQACQINVYQKDSGLFLDLAVNGQPLLTGQPCLDLVRIVRDQYIGFVGDLGFADLTLSGQDPSYQGLASRFALFYLEADDVDYDDPFFNVGSVVGTNYA